MTSPTATEEEKECRTAVVASAGFLVAMICLSALLLGFPGAVGAFLIVSSTVILLVAVANSGWIKFEEHDDE